MNQKLYSSRKRLYGEISFSFVIIPLILIISLICPSLADVSVVRFWSLVQCDTESQSCLLMLLVQKDKVRCIYLSLQTPIQLRFLKQQQKSERKTIQVKNFHFVSWIPTTKSYDWSTVLSITLSLIFFLLLLIDVSFPLLVINRKKIW